MRKEDCHKSNEAEHLQYSDKYTQLTKTLLHTCGQLHYEHIIVTNKCGVGLIFERFLTRFIENVEVKQELSTAELKQECEDESGADGVC